MATSQRFLKPLSLFQKRVAYANAFFTDFPVPAETAAFLNPDSNYPHHFVDDDSIVSDFKHRQFCCFSPQPPTACTGKPHRCVAGRWSGEQ
mmetsp:Transcript_2596/g.3613  ORF Transcript_2596/g.3613 Transcript_2596/m.3613 type:complete len:91 (+) Transcript_2596:427-699(+)